MKSKFMVASSEPMYDSIKLKLVCVSSGAPRLLIDAVQYGVACEQQTHFRSSLLSLRCSQAKYGVTDSSYSADSVGLIKNR